MYFYGGELLSVNNAPSTSSQEEPLDLSVRNRSDYPLIRTPEESQPNSPNVQSNPGTEVRPFKAYQRNPLAIMSMLPLSVEENATETIEEKYQRFRAVSFAKLKPRSSTNQNMRRTSQSKQSEDPTYREKREKNNMAAKRSRDARKMREDELTIRVAFLEAELIKSKTLNEQDKTTLQNIRNKIEEKKFLMAQQNDRLDQLKQIYFYELNNISKARG